MNKYVYKEHMEVPREQKEVVLSDIFQLDLLPTYGQILFLKEPFLQEMGIKTSLWATNNILLGTPGVSQERDKGEIQDGLWAPVGKNSPAIKVRLLSFKF